ncbi:MAG: glycosyltransferase family 4 protein [Lachnospiraceae bacterium]|nr:glycosyltransferase family 4 protein [Lachnospiraceae bacterium]
MKIALTTVQIPFVFGGAEFLCNNLKDALTKAGHEVSIVTMPFVDNPAPRLENHIIASRLMDINESWGGHIDLCIGLKFPAYFMPHENKVMWILHQHRAAYDLFDTGFSNLRDTVDGRYYRDIVKRADETYIPEAKRVYTIAKNVSNRMKHFNNLDSTPLYHPCPDMDKFYCGESENYILMPSRINVIKRQTLAIEALSKTKSNIKIYFVGAPDQDEARKMFEDCVDKFKVRDRVKCFDFVPQEEKIKLYANARAVIFIPRDEDYGYVTLEGMAASKPVITTKDSGGPLEFVVDNKTGMVCDPTPEALAEAMDEFAKSDKFAIEMGQKAKAHLEEMEITWERVVKELTK